MAPIKKKYIFRLIRRFPGFHKHTYRWYLKFTNLPKCIYEYLLQSGFKPKCAGKILNIIHNYLLTYSLTQLLTPWCSVLLDNLTGFELVFVQ